MCLLTKGKAREVREVMKSQLPTWFIVLNSKYVVYRQSWELLAGPQEKHAMSELKTVIPSVDGIDRKKNWLVHINESLQIEKIWDGEFR